VGMSADEAGGGRVVAMATISKRKETILR